MNNCRTILLKWTVIVCLMLAGTDAAAYNLRQISSRNGLSNSAILSLYQDRKGYMWIGTCDGLNFYDGSSVTLYPMQGGQASQLSGNLITRIKETDNDILWVQTNYGLDRVDLKERKVSSFTGIQESSLFVSDSRDHMIAVKNDGYAYLYISEKQTFEKLSKVCDPYASILDAEIDSYDNLWIFFRDREPVCFYIEDHGDHKVRLSKRRASDCPDNLLWVSVEKDVAFFIDPTYVLYEYDLQNQESHYVADLSREMEKYGEMSSLVKWRDDYYLGFKTGGLLVLRHMEGQEERYRAEETEIRSGIFCLLKDRYQDILWVGTDGQGVFMYYNDDYFINHTITDISPYNIMHPVRALYYDGNSIWIGTKGGGILRIHGYNPEHHAVSYGYDRLTTSNSLLRDNAVYCFSPGKGGRLWIGTEAGVDCYSFGRQRLDTVHMEAGGEPVRFVHSIEETNDSTLWIATVGGGIVKAVFRERTGGVPEVVRTERKLVEDGRTGSNYFFTSFRENDSTLWFGNRGLGAYRVDACTGQMSAHSLNGVKDTVRMRNDVFAIYRNREGYWLGTGSGLMHVRDTSQGWKTEQLTFNSVHGIMEDNRNRLWISSNQGLSCLEPRTGYMRFYNAANGLRVTEFSDGAFYKDPDKGTLYFGGVNGFVAISEDMPVTSRYAPPVMLRSVLFFGKEHNMHDYLEEHQGAPLLRLSYKNNFFQLKFSALDYLDGQDYTYAYRLKEINPQWIDNGSSSHISLSNLAPGLYSLEVKYRNNITGRESSPATFFLRIVPPWYLSGKACVAYAVVLAMGGVAVVAGLRNRYRRRQRLMMEKMDRRKKEEIYESKLRFFTNITHEFCTPLTLIYGPCEKILRYACADAYVRKYAAMVKSNAEKLNGLILELLEFRRLETGNRKLNVRRVPISRKMEEMTEAFNELAESRKMDYSADIEQGIEWGTDMDCFGKIVTNLLSNSFKYTPDGGSIRVVLKREEDVLCLRVSNTGQGISKEGIERIFDRYMVLDSFDMNDSKGARTGLGLAICKSMADLLGGEIAVRSVPGMQTVFTVCIPNLTSGADAALPAEEMSGEEVCTTPWPYAAVVPETVPQAEKEEYDEDKPYLLIVDDDPSMLWFVSDIFKDKYNVRAFGTADEAADCMRGRLPDLVISDVMMPGTDGLTFARKMKSDRRFAHIPLVLLSALGCEDDKVRGLDAGADAYVTKPFSVEYLERVADSALRRSAELKAYFKSMKGALSLDDAKEMIPEEREFLDRLMETLESNLSRSDLSVDRLAEAMGCSARQLYRKLKAVTDRSPSDIIKDYRIVSAGKLLLAEKLSVDEVMSRTGFINRGTFYKLFTQRFGMSPRQYREQGAAPVPAPETDADTAV